MVDHLVSGLGGGHAFCGASTSGSFHDVETYRPLTVIGQISRKTEA